ncbi:MAG TPA: biotin/lipoate A/B protein ligase family protein [Candidatus Nanoarchaeia archaeon]|nr:biotin/lipoate A/B protein ligase family protein [Candidatus Nanoarchaeia archaeon]
MKVRLLDTGIHDAFMNMAIDEALLSSSMPVLRFYAWKPAALSIGYFQSKEQFNFDALRSNNIDFVRRVTGGNAVLHDVEITYSFIIDESQMPASIVESYKVISKGLLQGLKNLGLDPRMNEEVTKGHKSAVCFQEPSWYEILVNGKKILGSAQKRIQGKLLQHGAILIEADIDTYCSLFKNYSTQMAKEVKKRMTSIATERNKKTDYAEVRDAMADGFRTALNMDIQKSSLTGDEMAAAETLSRKKYGTATWNMKY